MKLKTVSTFALALALSGCSVFQSANDLMGDATSYFLGGEDNQEPPAELASYEPEIRVELIWKESIGEGTENQFLNLGLSVQKGQLIAADKKGRVQARSLENGDLLWETETGFNLSAGPGAGEQRIYLAGSNADVIALDSKTGQMVWTQKVSSEILARPVVVENLVIIRTADGRINALSVDNGSPVWQFERNVPALTIRGTGTPVILDDYLIAGYANGKMVSLRTLDGKLIWETSIAIPTGRSEVERLVDIDVDPVSAEGVVFVAGYNGGTSAVLALDGDVLWRNEDVSSYAGLFLDWRYLYVTDNNSHVWQLDQRNGASLWKQDELHHRELTAPVSYGDYVVVADLEGYVHWLARADGRQLARFQVTDAPVDAKLLVVQDTVYVYAKNGTIAALKARSL
jgi:outer membrane protein assembly factor BamB